MFWCNKTIWFFENWGCVLRFIIVEVEEIKAEAGFMFSVRVTTFSTTSWFASIESLGVVVESLLFGLFFFWDEGFGDGGCRFSSSFPFFDVLWSKNCTVRFKMIPVVDTKNTARCLIWEPRIFCNFRVLISFITVVIAKRRNWDVA